MKPGRLAPVLALVSLFAVAPAARADSSPDFFVPPEECSMLSPECKCSDAPMLELFAKDRAKALDAWGAVADTLNESSLSQQGAVREFFERYKADQRIIDQFSACPDFTTNGSSLSKFAGISLERGGAVVDPCFCQQFCGEISKAVAAHEDRHFAFTLEALVDLMGSSVACKLGSLDQSYCDTIDARLLVRSEEYAYAVEVDSLQESLDRLRESDPDAPEMECTWEPLPDPTTRVEPAPPPPAGLWERIQMLGSRLLHGRGSRTG